MDWIGFDIGGANIKIAAAQGCYSQPFALWKHPENLPSELDLHSQQLLGATPDPTYVNAAVTMTGELADGYVSKQDGVSKIVDAVNSVFPNAIYYQTDGNFVAGEHAKMTWLKTAASNWHALTCWAARNSSFQRGFLVDIGSTTTDIIPFESGRPCSSCQTDFDRLSSSELLYTGVKRSPVCGIRQQVDVDGKCVGLANELFATMEDCYVATGNIREREGTDTADGRPQSRSRANQRIARMLCADVDEIGEKIVRQVAHQVIDSQQDAIRQSIHNVVSRFPTWPLQFLISGEGEWLAKELVTQLFQNEATVSPIHQDQTVSQCSPAVAVRELALQMVNE